MERDMASAADRALALELEIFALLRGAVLAVASQLGDSARALAEIDVATASAQLASSNRYCRPQIRNEPVFKIIKGRHPVIEPMLDSQTPFIANDCNLDSGFLLWPFWFAYADLTGSDRVVLSTRSSPTNRESSRLGARPQNRSPESRYRQLVATHNDLEAEASGRSQRSSNRRSFAAVDTEYVQSGHLGRVLPEP